MVNCIKCGGAFRPQNPESDLYCKECKEKDKQIQMAIENFISKGSLSCPKCGQYIRITFENGKLKLY